MENKEIYGRNPDGTFTDRTGFYSPCPTPPAPGTPAAKAAGYAALGGLVVVLGQVGWLLGKEAYRGSWLQKKIRGY